MLPQVDNLDASFQFYFHRRWGHLQDRHVRALAWLLDSPDLLDPQAVQWQGRIASINVDQQAITEWLELLDHAPGPLHAWLNLRPHSRLGRYAEKLIAYYFHWRNQLYAHGLQIRSDNKQTIGEFDFLLNDGSDLIHLEFATKFYLLHHQADELSAEHTSDYFLGPNLADSLGNKIRKILDQQLLLAAHPASQSQFPRAITHAKALIKGWLFYHNGKRPDGALLGLSANHCWGFWATLSDLSAERDECYTLPPRLDWLAPAKVATSEVINGQALREQLAGQFVGNSMPVLIARVVVHEDSAIEVERGFVVPDDWQTRAGERIKKNSIG